MSEPHQLAARFAQAVQHMAARRWNEASADWRLILQQMPQCAEAWDGLGAVAHHAGRHAEAEPMFRRAVALQPGNAGFRDHLGVTLRALGRAREAVAEYEKALEAAPDDANVLNNLGNALIEIGDNERAIDMLGRAVALAPREPGCRMNLVRALLSCQRPAEALEHLEEVRRTLPEHMVEVEYGHALMALRRHQEAVAAYRRAVAAGVRDHEMFHNLATALQDLGYIDDAIAQYREALSIRPDFVLSRRQLTAIRKHRAGDQDAAEIEALLQSPDLALTERADLHMGMAKILDDIGDYRGAFFHLQAGNQQLRSTIDYSAERNTEYIDAAIETFDAAFFADRKGFGHDSEVPIFIVGMPRSGTTLVEQILASHPQVHGAGELKTLNNLFAGLRQRLVPDLGMPRIARLIDRAAATELADGYLAQVTALAPDARFVVDKMPFNYRTLGLAALLFPKARFIHCRRDPRDTGLSCYFARFHTEMTFAFNLVEIGRYQRDYERLMAHWRRVLPASILEMQYEELVAEQHRETRRLLDFCGLDWDERCLRYYETERVVLTASNWQVRQPVYASSVGRWRHYARWLEPLFAALGPGLTVEPSVAPRITATPAAMSLG